MTLEKMKEREYQVRELESALRLEEAKLAMLKKTRANQQLTARNVSHVYVIKIIPISRLNKLASTDWEFRRIAAESPTSRRLHSNKILPNLMAFRLTTRISATKPADRAHHLPETSNLHHNINKFCRNSSKLVICVPTNWPPSYIP